MITYSGKFTRSIAQSLELCKGLHYSPTDVHLDPDEIKGRLDRMVGERNGVTLEEITELRKLAMDCMVKTEDRPDQFLVFGKLAIAFDLAERRITGQNAQSDLSTVLGPRRDGQLE